MGASGEDPGVVAFLASLEHPQQELILALRTLIGGTPGVTEGIKWGTVSFRAVRSGVEGWFATLNVRGPRGPTRPVLVLHCGAAAGGSAGPVPDPSGLLEWKGSDRALVTFADVEELRSNEGALRRVLAAWLGTDPR